MTHAALTFPLAAFPGRTPVISQGFDPRRHLGVDLMFARAPADPPFAASDPRGTRGFYVPPGAIAVACTAGRVIYAKQAANGLRVRFAARDGVHYLYLHLAKLYVADGDSVAEGQFLGLVGGDPTSADPHHTVHIHHEQRIPAALAEAAGLADGWGCVPVDPEPRLAGCRYVTLQNASSAP